MNAATTTTSAKTQTTYWPLCDANGNVSEYLDSSDSSIAAHYEYDPFGGTTLASGDHAAEFAHRFSSKFLDTETGLYYYGYRFLSTELGRWVSRDPIGELATASLYRYARNNAVSRYDIAGAVDVSGILPQKAELLTVVKQTSLDVQGQTSINGFFSPDNMRDSLYASKTRMVRCSCVGPVPSGPYVGTPVFLLKYTVSIDFSSEIKSDVDVQVMFGRYGHEQRHVQNFLKVIFATIIPRMAERENEFKPCCPSQGQMEEIETSFIDVFAKQIPVEVSHKGPPFFGNAYAPFPPLPETSLGILAYLSSVDKKK